MPILPVGSLDNLGVNLHLSDSKTSLLNLGSGSIGGYKEPPTPSGCFLKSN